MKFLVFAIVVLAPLQVLSVHLKCSVSECLSCCETFGFFEENSRVTSVGEIDVTENGQSEVTLFRLLKNSLSKFVPLGICDHLHNLNEMFILGAEIEEISREVFANCTRLIKLIITDTKIAWISADAFDDLTHHLETLDLSRNRLEILQLHFLAQNKALKHFNCRDNKLQVIEIQFGGSLEKVDLQGNVCINETAKGKAAIQHVNKNIIKQCGKLQKEKLTFKNRKFRTNKPLDKLQKFKRSPQNSGDFGNLGNVLLQGILSNPELVRKLRESLIQKLKANPGVQEEIMTAMTSPENLGLQPEPTKMMQQKLIERVKSNQVVLQALIDVLIQEIELSSNIPQVMKATAVDYVRSNQKEVQDKIVESVESNPDELEGVLREIIKEVKKVHDKLEEILSNPYTLLQGLIANPKILQEMQDEIMKTAMTSPEKFESQPELTKMIQQQLIRSVQTNPVVLKALQDELVKVVESSPDLSSHEMKGTVIDQVRSNPEITKKVQDKIIESIETNSEVEKVLEEIIQRFKPQAIKNMIEKLVPVVKNSPEAYLAFSNICEENMLEKYGSKLNKIDVVVRMYSISSLFIREGERFHISCEILTPIQNLRLNASFYRSRGKDSTTLKEDNHSRFEEPVQLDNRFQKIDYIIEKTEKERDQGDYYCNASGILKTKTSEIFTLNFVEDLPENNQFNEFRFGTRKTEFTFNNQDYPGATFVIFNKSHREIEPDYHFNILNTITQYKFIISYPKIADIGNYTLIIKTINGDHYRVIFGLDTLSKYSNPDEPMSMAISSSTGFFLSSGDKFQLTCQAEVSKDISYKFLVQRNGIEVETEKSYVGERHYQVELEINHVAHNQGDGEYTCTLYDDNNNSVTESVTVTLVTNLHDSYQEAVVDKENVDANFTIDITDFPNANFTFYDVNSQQISDDNFGFRFDQTSDLLTFNVINPDVDGIGNYTLVTSASNGSLYKTVLQLVTSLDYIIDIKVTMEKEYYLQEGQEVEIVCSVVAHPAAFISWHFEICENLADWPECPRTVQEIELHLNETIELSKVEKEVRIKFTPSSAGFLTCSASNKNGNDKQTTEVKILDIPAKGMTFEIDRKVAVGDHVELECAVDIYGHKNNMMLLDGSYELSESSKYFELNKTNTKYSWRKKITWKEVTKASKSFYICGVERRKMLDESMVHRFEKKIAILEVHDPEKPVIAPNFDGRVLEKLTGESLILECRLSGLPKPNLTWYKNDEILNENDNVEISIDMSRIQITPLTLEDSGTYKCYAWNRIGNDSKSVYVGTSTKSFTGIIVGVSCFVLALICVTLFLVYRVMQERKQVKELKAAGLANFEEGNLESFNPNGYLDEQADLLPYNKAFEFPRESLKLGKQLGAGAFGVVLEGIAEGIIPNEYETKVAVKMLKKMADNETIRALVLELKIMIHIGQHVNVVNLLGAITGNVAKKELMVIVEYCRFGCLQSFLVKNRPNFVNQNDEKLSKDSTSVEKEKSAKENDGNVRTLTTSDLIHWAYQIARGMDYLSSKKVLHGDLAARNVLLCDDNIVKICDFGLARSLQKSDQYKKEGKAMLPFKWIALESISDHVFSVYSDVWSFGILLWELFSLGQTPYPGIEANEQLFYRISDGYRMDKPQLASQEIFDIMLSCWNLTPETRPLFIHLEDKLESFLDENVKDQYKKLDESQLSKIGPVGGANYMQPILCQNRNSQM